MLSFIAYAVIPVYTLMFVSGTNWFTSNLSVIGSWPGRRTAFFFLGILIGLYYLVVLKRLLSRIPRHSLETGILNTAFLLLLLAVLTPYLPDSVPLQAFLHVAFAFTASVLLAVCLCLILWRLSALSFSLRRALRPYRQAMAVILGVSMVLLFMVGIVSSSLEIFFIIATTILVQRLYSQYGKASL